MPPEHAPVQPHRPFPEACDRAVRMGWPALPLTDAHLRVLLVLLASPDGPRQRAVADRAGMSLELAKLCLLQLRRWGLIDSKPYRPAWRPRWARVPE